MAETPNSDLLRIEVCHAAVGELFLRELHVDAGITLHEAIKRSGVLQAHPEIDLSVCKVGIHSKLRPLDTLLRGGDRVEIYRALLADPKDARRRRAKKAAAK